MTQALHIAKLAQPTRYERTFERPRSPKLHWPGSTTSLGERSGNGRGAASGITGAGFITLAATLAVVPTIPVAGMALILGIDRFMSECRAITNFIGNGVATVVVSKWEKELDVEQMHRELANPSHAMAHVEPVQAPAAASHVRAA